jgi:hypothetical protein
VSPTKPDYLTITPEEREQAKAEAARKQQQMLAAFEAGQAAYRLHRLVLQPPSERRSSVLGQRRGGVQL